MSMLSTERIAAVSKTFGGTIHTPGSSSYEQARRVFNGSIDRRPALVAT